MHYKMISRGKNYTEREKSYLLELIEKYKHIIENKCTNKVWIVTKHKTWEAITTAFNKKAEVPRTKKQLHTAYLNLKRSAKQSVTNDNNSVIAPDGSVFTPTLGCIDAQLLDVMIERVTPLSDDCSSTYDKNDEDCEVLLETAEPKINSIPQVSRNVRNTRKLQKHKRNTRPKNGFMKQYYRVKLDCAIVEKRTKLLEYRNTLRKQKLLDLEIKIKETEYEKLINK